MSACGWGMGWREESCEVGREKDECVCECYMNVY